MRDETLYLRNNSNFSPAGEIERDESGGTSMQPPALNFGPENSNTSVIQRDTGSSGEQSTTSANSAETNSQQTGPGSEIDQARVEYRRGRNLYASGNYQGALVMFQRALHRSGIDRSTSMDLVYNLGLCNYHLQRFPAAINYFEMYTNYNPEEESAQRYLSQSRQRTNAPNAEGEVTGVNNYASEAGSISENRPEQSSAGSSKTNATYQRALRQYQNGDFRSATYLFEQVRQAGNLSGADNADLLYNLGQCNLRMHRYSTAVFYFHQYLQSNPGDPAATEALRSAEQRSGIIGS